MQKHGTAAAGDARRGVVVDLDNEVVEVILAPQAVAGLSPLKPDRPVIVAVVGVFAPGVFAANRADRQECRRPAVTVGAPPQFPGAEGAAGGAAIALPLVGLDAATAERDRYRPPICRQPAPLRIAGGRSNPDRGQRAITRTYPISDWNIMTSHANRRI